MWNRRQRGVTLIELIVAIVIISIGVVGVVHVFSQNSINSADPMVTKQMRAVAEGLMEEIQHQPFTAAANAAAAGCARNTFNDLMDYNGYSQATVCDINGANLGLAGMSVAVTVAAPAAGLFPGVAAGQVLQITVTVTSGTQRFVLQGWRTNFL
jgi:MSHA pilin protein MshD